MPEKLPIIPDDTVTSRLQKELPGWTLESGWIRRTFTTDGWPTTLMLVNAIGFLSEAADHHPDLEVTWGRLRVRLNSHDSAGITEKDFALAKELERLALWRPPQGSVLRGTPGKFVSTKRD